MEEIYRLIKAKYFFSTHGDEASKFSPTGISNYPLSQPSLVSIMLLLTQYRVTVAPVLKINYNISKTELPAL